MNTHHENGGPPYDGNRVDEVTLSNIASAEPIDVCFCDRLFTFVEVPGYQTLWDVPERKDKGIYLWCIEFKGVLLANYVGKTFCKGGFEHRLWAEYKRWKAGLDDPRPVDIDAFKDGRIALNEFTSRESRFEILKKLYRIVLAPLRTNDECSHVESWIVDQLRRHPRTFDFLANRDKATKYRPAQTPPVRFSPSPTILGLTVPVPHAFPSA